MVNEVHIYRTWKKGNLHVTLGIRVGRVFSFSRMGRRGRVGARAAFISRTGAGRTSKAGAGRITRTDACRAPRVGASFPGTGLAG
jgi:hypothetical protein